MGYVSNDVLLEDISNTRKELEAYWLMSKGCALLSELPENTEITRSAYIKEKDRYFYLADDCNNFLVELLKLKLERGLKEQ
jgi:hypothetical protein